MSLGNPKWMNFTRKILTFFAAFLITSFGRSGSSPAYGSHFSSQKQSVNFFVSAVLIPPVKLRPFERSAVLYPNQPAIRKARTPAGCPR